MKRAFNINRQRLPQVRVEICQSGAVDHQVEVGFQPLERLWFNPQTWLSDVSLNNIRLFGQEGAKIVAMPEVQILKERRFGGDLLEAAPGRRRTLAPYEQMDFRDVGTLFEDFRQPDFADEPCEADQQNVFARERPPHGEFFNLLMRLEDYSGSVD